MPENIEFTSLSTQDTEHFGARLAKLLKSLNERKIFVALYGGLGAGKTAFVRGFVSVLCESAAVKSPTYTIVNEYCGQNSENLPVYHFDMYRISGEDDLYSVGFWDYLSRDGVCLCEWSENIPFALPKNHVKVKISKTEEENTREITVKFVSDNSLLHSEG